MITTKKIEIQKKYNAAYLMPEDCTILSVTSSLIGSKVFVHILYDTYKKEVRRDIACIETGTQLSIDLNLFKFLGTVTIKSKTFKHFTQNFHIDLQKYDDKLFRIL